MKRRVLDLFKSENNFLITTHISPDGDGIGSELALKRALESLGKNVFIVNHSEVPKNLKFLLKDEGEILNVKDFLSLNFDISKFVSIVVDMGSFERLGDVYDIIKKTKRIVVIDHHIVVHPLNVIGLIELNASATAEIVFNLIKKICKKITFEIAEPLYVAIETDTGSFRFSQTTSRTHRVVSELLKYGVSPAKVHAELYEKEKPVRLKLMGEVFSTIDLTESKKIAFMELRQEALKKLNAKIEDGDDLVNYLMLLEGVEVGFYFKELSENETKVSCRSKGKINLDTFLSQWGGGGHPQAAGVRLKLNIEDAKKTIIKKAEELLLKD